jgi:hypothetical protein
MISILNRHSIIKENKRERVRVRVRVKEREKFDGINIYKSIGFKYEEYNCLNNQNLVNEKSNQL